MKGIRMQVNEKKIKEEIHFDASKEEKNVR